MYIQWHHIVSVVNMQQGKKLAIAKTVWVLFCACVITDSTLVDLYPPFGRHLHTWMHTLMYMYTQPHKHAHATQKYGGTFTDTTPHTHMHAQHHVHTGWILSSPRCKPGRSWQDCGHTPSGWGYSRPAEQGRKLFFCHKTVNCCLHALENQTICALEACTFSALIYCAI